MKRLLACLACVAFMRTAGLQAQNYSPPPSRPPDDATLKQIEGRTTKLGQKLATLRQQGIHEPWLAEVEIYYKAAKYIVRHNEFYHEDSARWTGEALDRGLLRASLLGSGETPWVQQFGSPVVRAYRSRIDGSVQPYAVTWPKDYAKDLRKKWRLDIVLHGRDASLTEVKFLHQYAGDAKSEAAQDFVRLDIFGRGNNAYRWAGETDVFEALDNFMAVERLLGREPLLDPARVVLRGFSMGGAGTWHLGLHYPDRWCVIGPGAGFTTTHGYVKDLPDTLPDYQERCLTIYDAMDYAENVVNVPVVAYAGDQDPQLQAAQNIEKQVKSLRSSFQLLIAPGLGHRFPPEWQDKAEQMYLRHAGVGKGRPEFPELVRFTTYTLKYPSCYWVQVVGLDRHYAKALVEARHTEADFNVVTKNVRRLRLGLPVGSLQAQELTIDGQKLTAHPYVSPSGAVNLYLERRGTEWKVALPQILFTDQLRHLQKITGMQGPIDDAFMESFLCVRGTGQAWHEGTQKYAEANLKRFQREWDQFFRGELPIKSDIDVTDEDMAGRNLVLFGDPGSNSLIAHVLDRLPIQWNREQIEFNSKSYAAAEHVPVLIYPSPLNQGRYIVLNSGHTFHGPDFRGTNALLFPRLGDYAVLKLSSNDQDPLTTEVAAAGLFNDFWRLPKQP